MVFDNRIKKCAGGNLRFQVWLEELDGIFRLRYGRALFDVLTASPQAMRPRDAFRVGVSPGDWADDAAAWLLAEYHLVAVA